MASRLSVFIVGLLAALASTAHAAADSTPTGSLLIPNDEKDFSGMLSALMDTQHKMLQKTHGVDSPQVALSTSLVQLQTTVSTLVSNLTSEYADFIGFLTTTPSWYAAFQNDVVLINRQINATLFAISPNFGRSVSLGTPAWVQNKPNVATGTQTGASASAQLFNVAPCLFALSQQGVNVNPILIQVSPRIFQIDALGIQVQPELFTIDPTLINIAPNGVSYSPVNINASPTFITVSPTVKVVPGSGKAPTFSAGIAIKPNPDPPTITTAAG